LDSKWTETYVKEKIIELRLLKGTLHHEFHSCDRAFQYAKLNNGNAAGFQSGIYNSRGASGALYIQGIVFFRAGHVPVGGGDLVGLGGRL